MFTAQSNFNLPSARHISVAAPHTLALNSKQRMISLDFLQTITRILRSVGPRLEAAALQDAMQDSEATEFVTAAMAQAEASASNASTMTGSTSGAPPVFFSHIDGRESAPAASQLCTTRSASDPMRPATVLGTDPSTSTKEAYTTMHENTNEIPIGSIDTRPRRLSIECTTASASASTSVTSPPSVTQSPHSRSTSFVLSRDSSWKKTVTKEAVPHADPQERQDYCFPVDWFTATAVERLAKPHSPPSASLQTLVNRCEQRTDVPEGSDKPVEDPVLHDNPSHRTTAPSSPSTTHSTASFSSLPTMRFPEADASAEVTHTLPPPIGKTSTTLSKVTPSHPQQLQLHPHQKHSPPCDMPVDVKFASSTSPSLTQTLRVSGYGAVDGRTTVTTAQPPLFLDNMLLDPASGRFLFGGHAFREEARVFYVPPSMSAQPGATAATTDGSDALSATAAAVASAAAGSSRHCLPGHAFATIAPMSVTPLAEVPSLILVREYFPMLSMSNPGGGGDDRRRLMSIDGSTMPQYDIVVQSFSLLPPWLTQVPPNRYHLLSEAVTIACVCQALPGCVTVVTPLSYFLHGGRCFSLTASCQNSTQAKQSIDTFAFGGVLRTPAEWHGVFPVLQPLALSTHASALPNPEGEDAVESARFMAVAERLSAVPPDVLNEALAAVRYSLAFYSDYAVRRQRMRDVLHAVRVLQRFFRGCLAVKRRALRRMMRVWRTLEVEARLKLQQHRALPSAVERIDAVANTILQEHMLTSLDYKRKFIKDEWARRRAAFAKWKEEEEWNALFAEEQQARLQKYANSTCNSEAAMKGEDKSARTSGVGRLQQPSSAFARPRSARLTAEEEQRMADAFKQRNQPRPKQRQGTTGPASRPVTSALTAAGMKAVGLPAATAVSLTSPLLADVQAQRRQEALRRFCSWYIDPHELLFLSHQRLLETLKGTVLCMEEVQSELNRAAAEMAKEPSANAANNAPAS